LVSQVSGVVSASTSEADQIRELGVRYVGYFPTLYETVKLPDVDPPLPAPRVVHLGSMQATANRIGLERFFEIVWPIISQKMANPLELWVVGSLNGASKQLIKNLEQNKVICTGYVPDLTTVLRPYDIHIIPWEYDTGTRTRIPLVLNYAQTLVSTRAGAACISELQHGKNCLLVNNLNHMTDAIIKIGKNPSERRRLAINGRNTFLRNYTRIAMQNKFNEFLALVMN
jgi:glycosyltransferase involved in cell wall biosynthesis